MWNYGVFLFVKTLHFSSLKIVVCIYYKNEKNRNSYKSEIAQKLINVSRETCSNEK